MAVTCTTTFFATQSLLKAMGKPQTFSFIVLPAVYNCFIPFGFVVNAPSIPFGLWVWVSVLRSTQNEKRLFHAGIGFVAWTLLCLVHPFSAVFVFGGATLIWLLYSKKENAFRNGLAWIAYTLPLILLLLLSLQTRRLFGRSGVWVKSFLSFLCDFLGCLMALRLLTYKKRF